MVGLVGSRSLSCRFYRLVFRVVAALVRSGAVLGVGCSVGADAFVLRAALRLGAAARLRVFAACDRAGSGGWPGTAFGAVVVARDAGASVLWRAGSPARSLVGRLAGRTAALVRAVARSSGRRGLVAFVTSPCPPGVSPSSRFAGHGSGSWGAVAMAVGLGLPVVVFPCGSGRAPLLPGWWGGRWVPAGSGVWAAGFRFVPHGAGAGRGSGSAPPVAGTPALAGGRRSDTARPAAVAVTCSALPALLLADDPWVVVGFALVLLVFLILGLLQQWRTEKRQADLSRVAEPVKEKQDENLLDDLALELCAIREQMQANLAEWIEAVDHDPSFMRYLDVLEELSRLINQGGPTEQIESLWLELYKLSKGGGGK